MPSSHVWKFARVGGLDQVVLESADDLRHLDQLDQQLWVALSCPVKGLEIDEKTLALIDTDRDGRIGVPEVLAAVRWATARLKDPAALLAGAEDLPLTAIQDATPEGRMLLASARQILGGRTDTNVVTIAAASDTARLLAEHPLNGDGIIPPEATADATVQAVIRDIITCLGGTAKKSGTVGVTAAQITAFFQAAEAYTTWAQTGATESVSTLGAATATAHAATQVVRAKIDDYFARCSVAEFDARALSAVNRSESDYQAIATQALSGGGLKQLADFPLARVEPGRPLPLLSGANPAWTAALANFHAQAITPIWGAQQSTLTAAGWSELKAKLAAYDAWLDGRAGVTVEKLGGERLRAILAGPARTALAALVAQDQALEPEFRAVGDVERLARYHRDLRTLLHNFVTFSDLYSRDRYAAFQAGTLFLDSRSTELCLRVDGAHALSAMSKAYIAYCTCTPAGGGAPMMIAACFTQGDSDFLFVGRNGLFYDRRGQLWYAVITSIVDNPISIRQAFWSPYKKLIRFIEEQAAKRAAKAEEETMTRLNTATQTIATGAVPAKDGKPEPKRFDLALITGIGVAIGSIGGFLTAIFAKFVEVPLWQLPLVLGGLMLAISLPSMMIAALKLRQRTLGPILEANGWAINGRVRINIPFGTALTKLAALPPGATRTLEDPYEDKEARRQRRRVIVYTILALLAAAAVWPRWDQHVHGHYFWQSVSPAPSTPPTAVEAVKK
jgi:hypothetical protein